MCGAEVVVEQADLVMAAEQGLAGWLEAGDPLKVEAVAIDLLEKAPSQEEVILIVVDQQDSQPFDAHARTSPFPHGAGSSTISNQ